MPFSLIPREAKFFDMFDEFTGKLAQAGARFNEMVTVFDTLERRSQDLKRDEEACDACVENLIQALDRTFITPFDREDIHTLATSLDDIMDNMEKTAYRLCIFRLEKPTADIVELGQIIQKCCSRVESAVNLLRDLKRSEKIHALVREIGQLENDADRVGRRAEAALFADMATGSAGTPELLRLMQLRELYTWLEETVDACKHVANVISEIVIKGT